MSDPDADSLVRITGRISAGPRITLTLFFIPVHLSILSDSDVEINFGQDEEKCDSGTAIVHASMKLNGLSAVLGVDEVSFYPLKWLESDDCLSCSAALSTAGLAGFDADDKFVLLEAQNFLDW